MGEMVSFLLKDKQTKILFILKDSNHQLNVSEITQIANVTYVHTCNFIQYCERKDLVKTEKRGKKKYVSLTDKGVKVAEKLSEVYGILHGGKEQGAPPAADL